MTENAIVNYRFQLTRSPYHTLCIRKIITHSPIINTSQSIYDYLLLCCCCALSRPYHCIILYAFNKPSTLLWYAFNDRVMLSHQRYRWLFILVNSLFILYFYWTIRTFTKRIFEGFFLCNVSDLTVGGWIS